MTDICKANPCCGDFRNCVTPIPQHSSGMPWLNNPNWATAKETDDAAVDAFAEKMKEKLDRKRTQGYWGWEDKDRCSNADLSDMLRKHVEKGDPVDVANFAMMLHRRGERIAAPSVNSLKR